MMSNAERRRDNPPGWIRVFRLGVAAIVFAAAAVAFTPAVQAQPANDMFTNSVAIGGSQGSVTNDNIRATRETNEPVHTATAPLSASSVWYKWTPNETGPVVFDTLGSGFDTILAAYRLTGTNGVASLTKVTDNDDANPQLTSRIQFNVTQLTNYYIVVDGFGEGGSTAEGDFVLNWSQNATNPPVARDTIQFSSPTYTTTENGPFATITVWYGGPSDPSIFDTITVDYFTTDGTAIDGTNYFGVTNTIAINPVDPTTYVQTFRVTNINDTVVNNARTVQLHLANLVDPSGFTTLGVPAEATLLILDDEAQLFGTSAGIFSFSSTLYRATDSETLGGINVPGNWRTPLGAVITVNRSLPAQGRVLVDFTTSFPAGAGRIAAKPGAEYDEVSGTLVFDDYQMSSTFVVPVYSDGVPNVDKHFDIVLSNPRPDPAETLAVGDPDFLVPTLAQPNTRTTVEIIDLEKRMGNVTNYFSIERTKYRQLETVGQITVNVVRQRGGVTGTVGLRVLPQNRRYPDTQLLPGSDHAEGSDYNDIDRVWPTTLFTDGATVRTNPVDYTYADVTLNFPANGNGATRQTATFTIRNDDVVEFNEDFIVELHDSDNNHGIGENSQANLTIIYDDQPAGAADREWNPEGVARTQPPFNTTPGANNTVLAVAVQPDNRTVLVGDFTAVNAVPRNRIARMHPDGAVDLNFNPGSGANNTIAAVAVYGTNFGNTGQILIAGHFTSYNGAPRRGLARLNSNGSLDTTFNVGTGADGPVHSLTLQSDGKVLVAGDFAHFNDVEVNGIMRLNIDGSIDDTFNPGTGADGTIWAVAVRDTAQNIFIPRTATGDEYEDVNIIDTGANQGVVTIDYDFLQVPDSIRVYYDGVRIYDSFVSGSGRAVVAYGPGASTEVRIVMNEGSGITGTIWTYTANITPTVTDRSIYVAGEFETFNGVQRIGVARLHDDGSLDSTFDPGVGPDGPVYALAVQANNRVLIGGEFSQFQNVARGNFARLLNSGDLDTTHHVGVAADDSVYTITLQPDGKALLGGVFTSYNGTRRMGLARVHTSGVLDTSFLDTAYNQFAGLPKTYAFEPPRFVNSIALQANGDLMIGGSFTNVGGNYSADYPLSSYISWFVLEQGIFESPFTRADKVTRYNIARLLGGYTPGPGNVDYDPAAQPFAIDENASFFSATVRRIDGNLGGVQMAGLAAGNTATVGEDFDFSPFAASWPQAIYFGPMSVGYEGLRYLDIPIYDDAFREGDETFNVYATGLLGAIALGGELIPLGTAPGYNDAAQVSIADNDFDHGEFNFLLSNFVTNENSASATITVIRTNGTSGAVSVDYLLTTNGTARPGIDYVAVNGAQRLSFAAGQTTRTFTIQLLNDALVEPDRTISLILTNATGGATLPGGLVTSVATATLTIIDDDFAPGHLNFDSATYVTNENAGFVAVRVTRTGGSIGALSVSYDTTDGTALQPGDYTRTTNRLTWSSGDITAKTILIPIVADGLVEGEESFGIRLFAPSLAGALGPNTNAVITLVDADNYGTLSFSQPVYQVGENAGSAIITVIRRNGVAGKVSAVASAGAGTAIEGVDFELTDNVVTFLAGEVRKTFRVTVLDDSPPEADGDKTVLLSFTDLVNATVGPIAEATLTIIDDEGINAPAGSVDTTFSTDAAVDGAVYSVLLQTNGSMVIGGEFTRVKATPRNRIARLYPDGTLDNTFDVGPGADGAIRAMGLQRDSRIVVGGAFDTINGTNRNGVARLTTDGKVDSSFDPGSGADNPVFALLVLPNDKVILGGAFSSFDGRSTPGLVGLNTNGTVDTSFVVGAGVNGSVFALALQNDGKILVGGEFKTFNGLPRTNLARVNPDGSLDATFNPGFRIDGPVRSILAESDGRIVIGGSFTNVNGVARRSLARLEANGALDTTFLATPGAGADNTVFALAQQVDGSILVGGEFRTFNGVTRNSITRLRDVDGTTDPTINFGYGANGAVAALAIQGDGKIILGGGFTEYDGLPRKGLARIYGGSISGAGSVEFAAPEVRISESGSTALLSIARRGGTTGEATVRYETFDGTAIAGVDYVPGTGVVTFPEGETRQTIAVSILPNTILDGDRTAYVLLSDFTGAEQGLQPFTAITILDDESIISFSTNEYSVNENAISGRATIGVTRSGGTNTTISVNFTTVSGTAVGGVDFVPTNGTLVFLPGQTFKNFNVPVIDDTLNEANETLQVRLSNPSTSGVLGTSNATLVIVDNDFGAGVFEFASTNYPGSESAGNIEITVLRTNGSSGVASVRLRTFDRTATAGFDYAATDRILTFADGETVKSVTIAVQNDSFLEGNEFALLTLSNPTGGALLGTATNASLFILDDESGVQFQASAFSVAEDDGFIRIVVTRTGNTNFSAAVDFTTLAGTALEGSDYIPTNGTLMFGPGATSLSFDVQIIQDAVAETNEMFTVVLQNPSGNVQLGNPSMATVSVADSGRFIRFASATYSVDEDQTNAVISITRTGLMTRGISVIVRTVNGSALAGIDYAAISNIVKFAAGESNQTVLVPIINDGITEGPETVQLQLMLPVNAAIVAPATAVLTINDNDPGPGGADSTFDPGAGANKFVRAVEIQPDGRILVGGAFTNYANVTNRNFIARLQTNGVYDSSFDPGTGPNALVSSISAMADGRVVIGGAFTNVNGTGFDRVARLMSSGSLDISFSQPARIDAAVNAVVAQPDGRVLVGGTFAVPSRAITRLRLNGTSDLGFDVNGGADALVYAVALQPNGMAVVGGSFTNVGGFQYPRVVRLGTNGLVDVTFQPVSITNGIVFTVDLAPDGKIVIGGSFRYVNGFPRAGVARLNSDGSLDHTFNPGAGAAGNVYTVNVLSDGRVFAAGDFTAFNGQNCGRYILLEPSGAVDPSFDASVGADNTIYASALQADQKIVIGGDFTTVSGLARRGVARLNIGDPELRLLQPRIVGGNATFTTRTVAGRSYVLEWSDDLVYWYVLSTSTATGTTTVFTDSTAGAGEYRFYRVRRVEP